MSVTATVQTPLLLDAVDGAVDYKARPVLRSNSGGWRSASLIIGVEVAERFAYYGIGSNLITYLTGPLGQSTATAAQNVNVWDGTASLLTLLGAFLADSFFGRYRTIVVASLIYILLLETFIEGLRLGIRREVKAQRPETMIVAISLARRDEQLGEESCQIIKVVDQPTTGKSSSFSTLTCKTPAMQEESVMTKGLGLLTLSSMFPYLSSSDCQDTSKFIPCSPPQPQVILFFFSLYLVALGQGGHKPCVQAFGADQFDGQDPEDCKAKSSFFNWWYFCICAGGLVSLSILNYIQDNLSWGLGFGIPCITMVAALAIFLLGTRTYRYSIQGEEKSPFVRIGQVFAAAVRNWRTTPSAMAIEEEARGTLPHRSSEEFKFLNKALLAPDGSKEDGKVCSISEVEEAKAVLRLIPIWMTGLVYAIVFAQSSTFFTKQGATMDRKIVRGFDVPAASLQSFISLAIVVFIPIYDRIFVPIARAFSRKPSGITMLQRIGTGMLLSAISMAVAALVEMIRLKTAQEHGLVDLPKQTVPMSIWWLVPQYVLFGIADVFTMVGLQEFFYDQVPNELRSVGLSLYLSIFGVGSFLSSFLVSAIEEATGADGGDSWFANNLNRAHLDYFYWLLAGLSVIELAAYLYFAKSYIYNRGSKV